MHRSARTRVYTVNISNLKVKWWCSIAANISSISVHRTSHRYPNCYNSVCDWRQCHCTMRHAISFYSINNVWVMSKWSKFWWFIYIHIDFFQSSTWSKQWATRMSCTWSRNWKRQNGRITQRDVTGDGRDTAHQWQIGWRMYIRLFILGFCIPVSHITGEYEEATVMFSDVPNFQTIVSNCQPKDVVHLLNYLFTKFDRLVVQHEVTNTVRNCE